MVLQFEKFCSTSTSCRSTIQLSFMNLDINLSISRFQTPAGTKRASLRGATIIGEFAIDRPLVIDDPIKMCEVFANCPESPQRILRFTQIYGPLEIEARPGNPFEFPLSRWREWHGRFKWYWEKMAPSTLVPDLPAIAVSDLGELARILNLRGAHLEFSPRLGNSLVTDRFSTLMDICFTAIPIVRLRVCPKPDCLKCFVAHHLKQVFCGDLKCIAWGRRKLKLEYWERNKERLLAERKEERKGARNVTRKTR
jgi:hypothetical protein